MRSPRCRVDCVVRPATDRQVDVETSHRGGWGTSSTNTYMTLPLMDA